MRTNKLYVCIFKCSLNNRARAVILDLHEDFIYSWVKFEWQRCSSSIEQDFVRKEEKNCRLPLTKQDNI